MTSLSNSISNVEPEQTQTHVPLLSLTKDRPANPNRRPPTRRSPYVPQNVEPAKEMSLNEATNSTTHKVSSILPIPNDLGNVSIDNTVTVLNNNNMRNSSKIHNDPEKPQNEENKITKKVSFAIDSKNINTDQSKKTATWVKVARIVLTFIFVTVLGTILAFSWKSIKYGCKEFANSKVGDLFKKHFQETHEKVKSYFSHFLL